MKNLLIVLSGPSGVGKGTIARLIVEREKNFALSVSCTTRKARRGEVHGKEYFFISHEEFQKRIDNNGFLEYSEHFENFYGTPKDFVLERLQSKDVILEIDVNGGLEVKKNFPQALLIMIEPPSKEEVRKRLIKRNTESKEKIELRLERMDYELAKKEMYDYSVINDDLNDTVSKIIEIINKEKNED